MAQNLTSKQEHRLQQLAVLYRDGVCLLPDTARKEIALAVGKSETYVGRCLNPSRTDFNQDIMTKAIAILVADQEQKKRLRDEAVEMIKNLV